MKILVKKRSAILRVCKFNQSRRQLKI